jgi:hypothetical protein
MWSSGLCQYVVWLVVPVFWLKILPSSFCGISTCIELNGEMERVLLFLKMLLAHMHMCEGREGEGESV